MKISPGVNDAALDARAYVRYDIAEPKAERRVLGWRLMQSLQLLGISGTSDSESRINCLSVASMATVLSEHGEGYLPTGLEF